ncbi:hypothetical protein ABL78_5966 [Leptomonas seymouri]|uniref:Uncharacterized protein n=1 Tax=Leptomonas seymouri TaxID=5684 RepID=A0A0N1PAW9_LEPSE|nr:hypothetical protein ABL78_5966 [Leptomonas seymouri]|eukprot:KPI84975.1 hypothetical protein ABL78_5966 [Leptomonas seymouri]
MSLTAFNDTSGQPQDPMRQAAPRQAGSARDSVQRASGSSSLEAKDTAVSGESRQRDPPSPRRRLWSSSSPPSHVVTTARCGARAEGDEGSRGDSNRRETEPKSLGGGDERSGSRSRGVISGRSATPHTPASSSSITAALLGKGRDPVRKSRFATRAMGALRPKGKGEAAVPPGGISRRTTGNSKTQDFTPSSTRLTASTGDSVGSGHLCTSHNASVAVSAKATASPSACTSAAVEAFLLGMQNCLSKQELLFQRLRTRLASEDAASAPAPVSCGGLHAVSAPSSRGDDQKAETLSLSPQAQWLASSPKKTTRCDSRPDAASMRYSVGTLTEFLAPVEIGDTRPIASSSHTSHTASSAGSQLAPPDMELTTSFDAQTQSLPLSRTPSCSVVVMHPTLERATVNSTSNFLKLTEPASQPTSTSLLASLIGPQTESNEVTTSTSSEQLEMPSLFSSDVLSTLPQMRFFQRRPQPQSSTPAVPSTTTPSVLLLKAPDSHTPAALSVSDASVGGEEGDSGSRNSYSEGDGLAAPSSSVPTRRSSAVQWEGDTDSCEAAAKALQRTPNTASAASIGSVSAGSRCAACCEGATPPSSSSNPPPLPTLPSIRRSHSSSVLTGDTPSGAWSVSPPGAAAGSSVRQIAVSDAMSLLTSVDSCILSPLSRTMSTWGGSPMTHSIYSGDSPGLQARALQPQQQLHGVMSSGSFSATRGTPGLTRSPSGPAGRGLGNSPRQRSTAADRDGASPTSNRGRDAAAAGGGTLSTVFSASPCASSLGSYVSPPRRATASSKEAPHTADSSGGIRHPPLPATALSCSLSASTSRSRVDAAGGGADTPMPPPACLLTGDMLSPLSASLSLASSTPTTVTQHTHVAPSRNISKAALSTLSQRSGSSSALEVSVNEEAPVLASGQRVQHATSSPHSSEVDQSSQTQQYFSKRERDDGDDDSGNEGSRFAAVSVRSPVSSSGSALGQYSSGGSGAGAATSASTSAFATVAPTHRQLALSTSPSMERASHCEEEMQDQQGGETSLSGQDIAPVEVVGEEARGDGDDDGDRPPAATDSNDQEGDAGVQEEQGEGQGSTTTAAFNPFSVPPPPTSLSELHAYRQRRRLSAAPVPTMRRPPMAPLRPGTAADDAVNALAGPTAGGRGTAEGSDGAPSAGGCGCVTQQAQWLSFERQHEYAHLPECWRDSEVVVVDSVEEENRERDEEAEAELRLLEAELMNRWQATSSSSDKEEFQMREEEYWRRHSSRRHSYPGSSSYSSDWDRLASRGSVVYSTDAAAEGAGDDDEREWDDEVDASCSYQERLAQYGRMVLLQRRRRSLHGPRYRSPTAAGNSSGVPNGGAGGGGLGQSANSSRRAVQCRHHHLEKEDGATSLALTSDADHVERRGCVPPPPLSTSAAASPEPPETSRLFHRGHSAPVVVSDGGSTDWQNLCARFEELVTIQRRMRTSEEGSGDAATAASGGGIDPGDGSEGQMGGAGGPHQRSNSELLRSRRRRSRTYSIHNTCGPVPEFHVSTDADTAGAAAAQEVGSVGCADYSSFTRLRAGALNDDRSNSSAIALSSLSSMTALAEESQRHSQVYDSGERHSTKTEAIAVVAASSSSPNHVSQAADAGAVLRQDLKGSPAAAARERGESTDDARREGEDKQLTTRAEGLTPPSASNARGISRILQVDGGSDERSHSAPARRRMSSKRPWGAEEAVRHPAGEGTAPAHERHTSVPTTLEAPPPPSLNTQPTLSIEVRHAAAAAAPLVHTPAPAEVAGVHAGEETEEMEEIESLSSSSDGSGGGHGVGSADPQGSDVKALTLVRARAPRTPRLRFTHTPRGTTRPNALGRVRRVVMFRRASADASAGKQSHCVEGDSREAKGEAPGKKTMPAAASTATAAKRATTAAQEREQTKRTRAVPAGGDAKSATAESKRRGESRSAAGRAAPNSAGAALPSTTKEAAPQGTEVAAASGERRSKADQAPRSAAAPLSASHLAPSSFSDGGAAVEPHPIEASALSHVLLNSPNALPATTPPTAAMTAITKDIKAAAAASLPLASTLKAETKMRKATKPTVSAIRRRSIGADNEARSSAPPRRDKFHSKEEDSGQHRPGARPQPTVLADGDLKYALDSNVNSSGALAEISGTSESRALLRRLAQRKDRTRAMEERLQLSSDAFTSLSAVLAAVVTEGEDGAVVISPASTPMRSTSRTQSHAEAVHVTPPAPTSSLAWASPLSQEHERENVATAPRTLIVTPLASQEDVNIVAVTGGSSCSSGNSDRRHPSGVRPLDGPSVNFTLGHPGWLPGQQHAGTAATGKTSTRRRLLDVRSRPITNKQSS